VNARLPRTVAPTRVTSTPNARKTAEHSAGETPARFVFASAFPSLLARYQRREAPGADICVTAVAGHGAGGVAPSRYQHASHTVGIHLCALAPIKRAHSLCAPRHCGATPRQAARCSASPLARVCGRARSPPRRDEQPLALTTHLFSTRWAGMRISAYRGRATGGKRQTNGMARWTWAGHLPLKDWWQDRTVYGAGGRTAGSLLCAHTRHCAPPPATTWPHPAAYLSLHASSCLLSPILTPPYTFTLPTTPLPPPPSAATPHPLPCTCHACHLFPPGTKT